MENEHSNQAALHVAIVGSGPSAFFVTERLLDDERPVKVSVIERLPTPFGLVRFGVAPDHQATKNVTGHFQSLLNHDDVEFFGNVEIGKDISVETLRENFDAIVIATGVDEDRLLDIPGSDLPGVYGAWEIVSWYNGHPYSADKIPDISAKNVVIVGLGNVALDLARIFAKQPDSLAESDIPAAAQESLAQSEIEHITIVGRKGPAEAKFTNPELREFARVEGLDTSVSGLHTGDLEDAADLPRMARRNLKTIAGYAEGSRHGSRHLEFMFHANPIEYHGIDKLEAITYQQTNSAGKRQTITCPCDMVVTAIGFRTSSIPGLPYDEKAGIIPNDSGRVDDQVFVVGWAGTGPNGVIGTNKPPAYAVAENILGLEPAHSGNSALRGAAALSAQLEKITHKAITVDGWQKIENAEINEATGASPRQKITSIRRLLEIGG